MRPVKVAYLVTHPIQYQAPLLRRIAQERDIELTVFFGSDLSVRGYEDEGFGVQVRWDVPLLAGYQYEFLPVLRDASGTGFASPLNYGIYGRLSRGGFDVLWLHGYSTLNALQAMFAAKALGIPVLLRAESWLKPHEISSTQYRKKRMFFLLLRHLIDAVLPIGSRNAVFWQHYMGAGIAQFPMPYAVDNTYFRVRSLEARSRRSELLEEFDVQPGRPVILFASKLIARKCCGDLISAYEKLCMEGEDDAPYLLIVGDGDERMGLEAQVAVAKLSRVRFCGFRNQSELPRFFELATVFVLPSRHEPWGLIVNEVMNAARAVIVSDEVGCQSDLVRDGVEGAVFPAGDVDGLADAIRRVLLNPENAIQMGKRALERVSFWSIEDDIPGLRQAIAQVTRKLQV